MQVSTGNASNTLLAELVDPATGEAASTATNGLLVTNPSGTTQLAPETGAQLHVLRPAAGRWTLVVDFYGTVSGTAVAQPFTVTINDTPVTASAAGLPDSASTTLAAGHARDRARAGDERRQHPGGILRRSPAQYPGGDRARGADHVDADAA